MLPVFTKDNNLGVTDEITEYLAQKLGCHAYINKKIKRSDTDFNNLLEIETNHPSFLNHLNQCVVKILGKLPDENQKLYLITIHGYRGKMEITIQIFMLGGESILTSKSATNTIQHVGRPWTL